MENLSAYRYCIAMKKGRKIFIIIAGCTMILISSIRSVYKELHADHKTGAADNK